MKDKTRVTVMVCFAADGNIFPLAVVGRIKQPLFLRLITDGKSLFPYNSKFVGFI